MISAALHSISGIRTKLVQLLIPSCFWSYLGEDRDNVGGVVHPLRHSFEVDPTAYSRLLLDIVSEKMG